MANFIPLKNYMFYCLDRLISKHKLMPPFLDVGCGSGDVSKHVASRGWTGESIDFSDDAIEKAKLVLQAYPAVKVEKISLFEKRGSFRTIFAWDVIEHIENDGDALKKLHSLLTPDGHIVISVPGNKYEWGWDDEFYGHCRRYSVEEIRTKLIAAGFMPLVLWDVTFPFFWFMRRVYVTLKLKHNVNTDDSHVRTKRSSAVNAWSIPGISNVLNNRFLLWNLIYFIQFKFFKNKIDSGFEFFVLAKKAG